MSSNVPQLRLTWIESNEIRLRPIGWGFDPGEPVMSRSDSSLSEPTPTPNLGRTMHSPHTRVHQPSHAEPETTGARIDEWSATLSPSPVAVPVPTLPALNPSALAPPSRRSPTPDSPPPDQPTKPPQPETAVERGRNLGRFRLESLHARGGLGEVYRAVDSELDRRVALKRVQPRLANHPSTVQRFLREAVITASLEHPSIIPVYGLGKDSQGQPYYAMRFVKGRTLGEAIEELHGIGFVSDSHRDSTTDQAPRDPEANSPARSTREESFPSSGRDRIEPRGRSFLNLLNRFLDVCHAIAYAHDRGFVHRDLKPDNILLGEHNETLVVDWGLAKRLGAGRSPSPSPPSSDPNRTRVASPTTPPPNSSARRPTLDHASRSAPTSPDGPTQAGQILGTPSYMSPEQAAGKLSETTPASDIYSLGAILFTILTGRPPIVASNVPQLIHRVRLGMIDRPRSLVPRLDRALEAICLKALALDPNERYATAQDLAADLERWIADEPIRARPETLRERVARSFRRHGLPLILGLVFVLLNGVFFFQSIASSVRIAAIRADAEADLADAATRGLASLTTLSTWVGLAALLLLPLVVNAIVVWGLMRWPRRQRVSMTRALVVSALTGFVVVNPPGFQSAFGVSFQVAALLSALVSLPIVLTLVRILLRASWLKVVLVMLAAPLGDLAVVSLLRAAIADVRAVGGHGMAPTLLGEHHRGVCPACGKVAYGPHRSLEVATPVFGLLLPRTCPLCVAPGAPRAQGEAEPDDPAREVNGVCRDCRRLVAVGEAKAHPDSGDLVFINHWFQPRRWDMVAYQVPGHPETTQIHRVIGLPGETVVIQDGQVFIDGKPIDAPAEVSAARLRFPDPPNAVGPLWGTPERPARLGPEDYFLLGDYPPSSVDSRIGFDHGGDGVDDGDPHEHDHVHEEELDGPPYAVPRRYLRGVVTHRLWPLWRFEVFR